MVLFKKLVCAFATFALAADTSASVLRGKPGQLIRPYKRAPLQDIVTWDEHSLFVHGERVLLYSGEFHPFRLPVTGLWLDVFQKIRALGYNGVSFYVDWALVEGTRGVFRAEGIFDLEPFFQAAKDAGVYLLARPGPYINAEASGGGFPGWLQRIPGQLRTAAPTYLNATNLYAESVGKIIAAAQITNGGPVILVQPENEYTQAEPGVKFPNADYFAYVENQLRSAGIVVPLIENDAAPDGHFVPGSGKGAVDIYGHDGYPLGFDCANPETWPDGALPTDYRMLHEEQSPSTPYSLVEFQGGSFDPWGGLGFAQCAELLNSNFERVFYKNDFSFGVTIFNIYMTYGGTNWGNLGHPGGYTSYDYGAVITEDRLVTREKYSEAKLEANFLQASRAYLTATPQSNANANGSFTTSSALAVTQLLGNGTDTNFYVVRHAFYNTFDSTEYKLELHTSAGNLTIPQITGHLTLNGRDSKVHVTDYHLEGQNLLYSTAEIFTWKKDGDRTVLVVYGGPNERHELAFSNAAAAQTIEGSGVTTKKIGKAIALNFEVSPDRRVVKVGSVFVYILDRYSAYNYWTLNTSSSTLVANAGYLLRNATISGTSLALVGDLNATAVLEVISGAPTGLKKLTFNGKSIKFTQDTYGVVSSNLTFVAPTIGIPTLADLEWKYHDALPEISEGYDDSLWTSASLKKTHNSYAKQLTPTSLFGSDYGYNTGSILLRGHFVATGAEKQIAITTQGGDAFGSTVWVNNTLLGSWGGNAADENYNATYKLPVLKSGKSYVFTVLVDNMGLDENGAAGDSGMKNPRGILKYQLSSRAPDAITWKMTGNLGGEDYRDLVRGPLNEGAMYPERQGWHQPDPPSASWVARKPSEGIARDGVGFFSTSFDLNFPTGYDVPLSFVFSNKTAGYSALPRYRVQLFVNGYQFGKYVNNIGPQTVYPVPEGILNHHGTNWVAMTLWAQDADGAKVANMTLQATGIIQSGYGSIPLSPMPAYSKRAGAY